MSESMATDDPVLTVTQLCRRWQCDRHTVLEAIHSKRLTAFRLGKRSYRVALAEVTRYELERASS